MIFLYNIFASNLSIYVNFKLFHQLQMNFFSQLVNSKTPNCSHEDGCILNSLKIMAKNFKYGLVVSVVLQIIRTLRKITKGVSKIKGSF